MSDELLTIEQEAALNQHLVGVYCEYSAIENPRWANAGKTLIDAEVTFVRGGKMKYTSRADDITRHCPEIFARCEAGEFGPVADFVPPTVEELRVSMPALDKWRLEAMIDLYGQEHNTDLRGQIDAAIDAMPEPSRTIANSKRINVNRYYRDDPLFDFIGSDETIAISPEAIDTLWAAGLAL